MPARNPEAVRQRAAEAARQRSGRPAIPGLDPVFVALNHGELPVRARTGGELAQRVRRAEDYAALGARVVVELHTESHAASPAPAREQSPAAPTAATAGRSTASSAASVTRPAAPPARTDPSTRGAGDGCRCPMIPSTPTSSLARLRFALAWSPTGQPVGA
jgi:hypothetical protein